MLSTGCRPSTAAPQASLQPRASVTFLGFTNDGSGTQLASFAITNRSQIAVVREPKFLICGPRPPYGWAPISGGLLPGGRVLDVGASEIVTIKPPATQTAWRVTFYICNDFGIKRQIRATRRFLRLPSKYVTATYQADSGRIEGQPESDLQRVATLAAISNAVKVASGLRVGMPGPDVSKYMREHGKTQTDVRFISLDRDRTMTCPYPLTGTATLMLEMHSTNAPFGLFGWRDPVLDRAHIQYQGVDIISVTLTNGTVPGIPAKFAKTGDKTTLTPEQAGSLAQQLANERAQTLYNCQPFYKVQPARLADSHWSWHQLQGQAKGDMEAKVEFKQDGAEPNVSVMRLESLPDIP